MTEVEGDFQKAEANLARALTRAGDCEAAYREANDRLRRQFNMAFFNRLLLSDEGARLRASWHRHSMRYLARNYGERSSRRPSTS
jgi:hypothetical protein